MRFWQNKVSFVSLIAVLAFTFIPVVGAGIAADTAVAAPADTGVQQADGTIFSISAISGRIGDTNFDSLTQLNDILAEPVLGGTAVEIRCTLQLQTGTPKYEQFLMLSSDLEDVSFDADPPEVKPGESGIWHSQGEKTALWVPPQHQIREITVIANGTIPEPLVTEETTIDNKTVTRMLMKEMPDQAVLSIKVMESTSGVDYADKPQSFVETSFVRSYALVVKCTATNAIIKDAREKIADMENALALLEDPQGEKQERLNKMPATISQALMVVIQQERQRAESAKALFEAGEPAKASEMAVGVTEDAVSTGELIEAISAKGRSKSGYVLAGIIGVVVGIGLGIAGERLTFGRQRKEVTKDGEEF